MGVFVESRDRPDDRNRKVIVDNNMSSLIHTIHKSNPILTGLQSPWIDCVSQWHESMMT